DIEGLEAGVDPPIPSSERARVEQAPRLIGVPKPHGDTGLGHDLRSPPDARDSAPEGRRNTARIFRIGGLKQIARARHRRVDLRARQAAREARPRAEVAPPAAGLDVDARPARRHVIEVDAYDDSRGLYGLVAGEVRIGTVVSDAAGLDVVLSNHARE